MKINKLIMNKTVLLNLFLPIAISMIIFSTIKAQIPTNGLVARYTFRGNANDSSGNGNNGIVNGATLTTDRFGNPNGAYLFNSNTTSQISLNLSSVPNGLVDTFSILLWVKPTDTISIKPESNVCPNGSSIGLVNAAQNWAITPFQVNNPNIGAGGLSVGSNGFLTAKYGINILDVRQNFKGTLNGFNCIVQTYRFDSTFLYLNGVLVSAKPTDCPSARIILPSSVKLDGSLYSGNFSGIIDEAIIWSRALTNQEIQSAYHEGGYVTPQPIPTNGLVAWYPFKGNAKDSSVNGNNGTVNGATLTTDRFGNNNSAYSFNGTNSQISVPSTSSISNFPNGQTISFWMKISSFPTDGKEHYMIQKTDNFGSPSTTFYQAFISDYTNVDNIVYRYAQSASISSQGTAIPFSNIILNKWFHISFTTNLTNTITYINGVKFQTFNQYSLIGSTSNPLVIGNGIGTFSAAFNGNLDDIRIYNRALDSTEVKALYNEGGYVTILPLKITDLKATNNNGKILINWSTVAEVNTNNFIIQRSADGNNFTDIGSVNAVGTGANDYQYTDLLPFFATNYYRLKIIDKDGKVVYTPILMLTLNISSTISISPNPTKGLITLQLKSRYQSEQISINIYDLSGKNVFQQIVKTQMGNTSLTLDVSNIQNGIYYLNINSKSRNETLKLIKN